jgi:rubrerythrin
MGGKPSFLPRHTPSMRTSFQRHTQLRNVAAAVYGIVAGPHDTVVNDNAQEQSLHSDLHDCLQCVAQQDAEQLEDAAAQSPTSLPSPSSIPTKWVCNLCTFDGNPTAQKACSLCDEERPAVSCSSSSGQSPQTDPSNVLAVSTTPSSSSETWICLHCRTENTPDDDECDICERQRPAVSSSSASTPSAQTRHT